MHTVLAAAKVGTVQSTHPLCAQEHEVFAADGTRCLLWHWPAPEPGSRPAAPMWLQGAAQEALRSEMVSLRKEYADLRGKTDVLLLHGNAGNRQTRLLWMFLLREGLGLSVTVLDYRGYGGSDGSPTETGLISDGVAAARWLSTRHAVGGAPVVWGESIGCGVAVAIVANEPTAALVLEAGFTSAADLGKHAYPFLPVKAPEVPQPPPPPARRPSFARTATARARMAHSPSATAPAAQLFMWDTFDSIARAPSLPTSLPVLSIHGTLDDIAPIGYGRKLYDALPCEQKKFATLDGAGHNVRRDRDEIAPRSPPTSKVKRGRPSAELSSPRPNALACSPLSQCRARAPGRLVVRPCALPAHRRRLPPPRRREGRAGAQDQVRLILEVVQPSVWPCGRRRFIICEK